MTGFVEWRQHKDPNYELTRLEQDIGLQGIPELVDGSTQTSWFRSVNSALQYEPIVMDPKKRQTEMDAEKMQQFLERMLPLVEQALQQNETFDIFLDPFSVLNEEDPTLSNKNENSIKELRSFTDLVYSKNKTLSAIDWHPKKNGVVAVAAAANVNFSKRLDLLDKIDSSFILIWNFVDLIHPQLMLEAPQDVLTLRFNPSQPHIIAGGLYNGQVLVWDFSKAEHLISKGRSKNANSKSSASHDEPQKQIPPVKPTYVSYIDASHRRPVADLMWLPAGMEVNNRGHLVPAVDPYVNQFVTIAGDGQVSFWDLRFKDPKYRGITRTKVDKNSTKDAPPEVHFIPIYSISLTKVESSGELGLKCFRFERQKEDSSTSSSTILSSRFYCGTEEGEFVYADWRPHAASSSKSSEGASRSNASKGGDDDGAEGGGSDGVEYVQWICRDHFRPIVGLCASPFFPSIFLTASESNFHLWNVSQHKASESNGPIFMSPLSLSTLTCVAFSPTRPGVIYVGKSDGMLEVWDFMDQSHRSSLSIGVTACALTSIEFRPHISNVSTNVQGGASNSANAATTQSSAAAGNGATKGGAVGKSAGQNTGVGVASSSGAAANINVKQQLVAIGDQIGNLHIMEIPRTLSRATNGERQAMEAYFKRESERMKAIRKSGDGNAHQLSTRIMQGNNSSKDDNSSSMGGASALTPAVMAGAKAAAGGADAAVANPVDDEIFRRMETEFCRDLGLDASNNNTAATA
uniref:Uncharacterized protein n=1 Tax=Globisporangium ultimum (strain ATCC 200006 / CBS 805.95 / DAOM BR144) TaxID=431595 RepID=K3W8D7_GLOUD